MATLEEILKRDLSEQVSNPKTPRPWHPIVYGRDRLGRTLPPPPHTLAKPLPSLPVQLIVYHVAKELFSRLTAKCILRVLATDNSWASS